jgi:hypothetical protein
LLSGIMCCTCALRCICRNRADLSMSALRPPALVCEYLASGSLRAAITRKAEFLQRDSVKIKLALDAARVSVPGGLCQHQGGGPRARTVVARCRTWLCVESFQQLWARVSAAQCWQPSRAVIVEAAACVWHGGCDNTRSPT